MEARSRPCHVSTAFRTAALKVRNCRFSCGVSPGFSKLFPRSSPMLQFRCLPEPLTPANGFSWSRQASPNFGAAPRSTSPAPLRVRVARTAGDRALRRAPPRHLHRHHLMVGGDVGVLEDGRDLVLARRDFVVTRL